MNRIHILVFKDDDVVKEGFNVIALIQVWQKPMQCLSEFAE